MKVGRLWFLVAMAGLSFASFPSSARAGEPGPPPEAPPQPAPQPAPYDDEEEQQLPPGVAPPVQAAPVQVAPVAPPPVAAAPAGPDTGFGFLGQITVSDDLMLVATQRSFTQYGQEFKVTQVQLKPAVDFFPIPNLSIGGQLVIGYQSVSNGNPGGDTSQTELALFGRVGYAFAFSPTTYLWPRVSLGYDHFSGSLSSSVAAGGTGEVVPLEIYVPVVFLPAAHFFIGLGPVINTQLRSKQDDIDQPKITTIGLQSTLGGCFRAM